MPPATDPEPQPLDPKEASRWITSQMRARQEKETRTVRPTDPDPLDPAEASRLIAERIRAKGKTAVRPAEPLPTSLLAAVLVLFALSAFAMDAIGIHAVFGGFLLGCVMPRGPLTEKLRATLQPFVVVFLLPMFFTVMTARTVPPETTLESTVKPVTERGGIRTVTGPDNVLSFLPRRRIATEKI